jgi:hypothetical protein
MKLWVPIVIVPVRALVVVLAATVYATVPVPVPELGVTVSQLLSLASVQLHPDVVVTVKLPVPPAAPSETPNGDNA